MGHGVGHHIDISIHALREEGDDRPAEFEADGQIFLSTPSVRRATPSFGVVLRFCPISIHALREEGDQHRSGASSRAYTISIHALREEGDLLLLELTRWTTYFYPRPP